MKEKPSWISSDGGSVGGSMAKVEVFVEKKPSMVLSGEGSVERQGEREGEKKEGESPSTKASSEPKEESECQDEAGAEKG